MEVHAFWTLWDTKISRSVAKHDLLFVFLMAFVCCLLGSWSYPITILDESRNAEAAREMWVSGDYWVPFFNGQLRTDKPPLHYLFMAIGYSLFGVNAFGARFFSAVFGALTMGSSFFFVKRFVDRRVAWLLVLVLLAAPFWIQEFHLAVPDPYLIACLTIALFSFFALYQENRAIWWWLFYDAMGLGTLAKGPVAVVLPGLAITLFLVLNRDFRFTTILKFRPFLGMLLLLLIACPWYFMVHWETDGAWTRGFFLDHNISRFEAGKEGHGGLFLITPLYVLLGLLPFSFWLFPAIQHAWKNRKENILVLFSLSVGLSTIVFFSFSGTKLPNYPMPCYPFLAVLLGYYFKEVLVKQESRSFLWGLIVLLLVSVLLPIAGFIALGLEANTAPVQYWAFWLVIPLIAGVLGFHWYRKGKLKTSFASLVCGWMLLSIILFSVVYPKLNKQSPVAMAKEQLDGTYDMVAYQRFDSAFPINFNRTIPVLQTSQEVTDYLKLHPKTYVISTAKTAEELGNISGLELLLRQKALFENHTTFIYTLENQHQTK